MTGFRFTLEKALELRRLQLQLEETKFQRQTAALVELDRIREGMLASRAHAEAQVREGGSTLGIDLAALGAFRRHIQGKEKALAQRRAEEEKKLEQCRAAMLEARRRCKLLERLKERRKAEWEAAFSRELEQVAAESFLAQWNRGQA
jgi:flagellar export protein FliJ